MPEQVADTQSIRWVGGMIVKLVMVLGVTPVTRVVLRDPLDVGLNSQVQNASVGHGTVVTMNNT